MQNSQQVKISVKITWILTIEKEKDANRIFFEKLTSILSYYNPSLGSFNFDVDSAFLSRFIEFSSN